jgi:hypothetical protein
VPRPRRPAVSDQYWLGLNNLAGLVGHRAISWRGRGNSDSRRGHQPPIRGSGRKILPGRMRRADWPLPVR